MKLNEKYVLDAKELSFLGHDVSTEGVAHLATKVGTLVHAPIPTLQSFMGLV